MKLLVQSNVQDVKMNIWYAYLANRDAVSIHCSYTNVDGLESKKGLRKLCCLKEKFEIFFIQKSLVHQSQFTQVSQFISNSEQSNTIFNIKP